MNTLSYKTVSANSATVNKEWVLVDADGQTLGRLASKVAKLIRGKYKPNFTPHVDCVKKKGYRLVGANELGFNFIFVKNGLAENELPEVSVESVLTHPSVKQGYESFEPIKDWLYETPD